MCHACQRGPRVNVPINVPTCQRAKQVLIIQLGVPTSQKHANFSTWCTNVPKGVPFFQLHLPKCVPIIQLFLKSIFQFLNFSITLNICKFQKYLGSSRKFILRNKEFKFWHLQCFIKEKSYLTKTKKIKFWHSQNFIKEKSYLAKTRKFKFWHLQNLIKEKSYKLKTFEVIFNRACGINRTNIRLV